MEKMLWGGICQNNMKDVDAILKKRSSTDNIPEEIIFLYF